ncbi:transcription termination factor NusA [uncultured Intestinimonas sp.]|uniref:transcription termination factor NusA n=1 Tax=uncultured Intestinimonas sp. TaxID=1689265 RepID=UPI00262A6F7D|nr:transcription termination factor NusA [uncultured Intestinimonas sp.]
MPRKTTKKPSNESDGKEFFAAIRQIEQEKGIPAGYMMEKITQALASAYKRDHEGAGDNIEVKANPDTGEVKMYVLKDIVEEVDDPATEIALSDAQRAIPHAQLGDVVRIEVKPKNFGRIAAQTARQVIIQGIREAERGMVYDEFSSKEHEILTGVVTRIDPRSGAASLRISSSSEYTEAFLAPGEQVKGEAIREGDRLRVYVVEVRRSTRGPQVLISRTHPGLVKRLFELEIPEIFDGTVEVKSIAREAGSRTKLAVWSADPNVDPIGACVGPRGQRVNTIVEELKGEKMDIIKYSEDPAEYIAAALSPADVISVDPLPDGKSCRVVVPDDQLSLAIGKEGQNARLAAKLTGYKIDIKPESDPGELPAAEEAEVEIAEEPEEPIDIEE